MPKRLDRVHVTLASREEPLAISWDSRNHLLARMRGLDGFQSVATVFDAVGASRPVELNHDEKKLLFEMLDEWGQRVPIQELPAGLWDLRCRLADDLTMARLRQPSAA